MSSISIDCETQSNSIHELNSIELEWVRLKFSLIGFDLLYWGNKDCKCRWQIRVKMMSADFIIITSGLLLGRGKKSYFPGFSETNSWKFLRQLSLKNNR